MARIAVSRALDRSKGAEQKVSSPGRHKRAAQWGLYVQLAAYASWTQPERPRRIMIQSELYRRTVDGSSIHGATTRRGQNRAAALVERTRFGPDVETEAKKAKTEREPRT